MGKYASKKSKAEMKKEQNLQKMSKSRCCSWSTLFYLLILTGAGMAAVKQYPDQVQEGIVQARDATSHTWEVVSSKSIQIYGQGISMVKEGYAMIPPQVREHTDPILEASVKYSQLGLNKVKEGYVQVADVIVEQYELYLPTATMYWDKLKTQIHDASKVGLEHGGVMLEHVQVLVRDFYAQVVPQAQIYFETAKDFTVKYGKIGLGKTADLT